MIIYSGNSDKEVWPESDAHDPDSEVEYQIHYFLPVRADSKAYTKGIDLVVPLVANGCMYECVSGGISADTLTPPPTKENKTHEDGDVTWKCKALTTRLTYGDTFTSSWTADTGITLTEDSIIDGLYSSIKVTSVPSDILEFEITNTINITYSTGRTETRQKTLIIPIKEL